MLHSINLATAVLALASMAVGAPTTTQDEPNTPICYDAHSWVDGQASTMRMCASTDTKAAQLSAQEASALLQSFNPDESLIAADNCCVIGQDDRSTIGPSAREWPFRPIGKIISHLDGYRFECSGALVGPRHVLTAKHCVNLGPLRFIPAYDYGNEPYGGSGELLWFTMSNSSSCIWEADEHHSGSGPMEWDFAIIVLKDRLGDKVGWFGTRGLLPDMQMHKPIFMNAGYPYDREFGEAMQLQLFAEAELQHACGIATAVETNVDAGHGQSGSPLFAWNVETQNVDVYGAASAGDGNFTAFAGGQAMIDLLRDLRQKYP